MFRLILIAFLVIFVLSSSLFALNQVKIFVPADSMHGEQELRLGHPNDIYIEVSNDDHLRSISIYLIMNSSSGDSLWDTLTSPNYRYTIPSGSMEVRSARLSMQDNIWPDTLYFHAYTSYSNYLPPGTRNIIKLTIVPHTLGSPQFEQGIIRLISAEGDYIQHEFISEEITILPDFDCNDNGVQDYIDITNGTSSDCNVNYIPDECETESNPVYKNIFNTFLSFEDCNNNGVPDECEASSDCNGNGIPDECEEFSDCNNNGISDDCELDCNFNGIPDECEEIADCNCNGIPDEDDIALGYETDSNGNSIPDVCDNFPDNYYRVIVPPNERRDAQTMHVGFEEEIFIMAHTNLVIDAAVAYADFEYSGGIDLWDYIDGIPLQTYNTFNMLLGLNYFDNSKYAPDTLEGYGLSLASELTFENEFQFMKLTVVPTDTGMVIVTNSSSYISGDSSFFHSSNYNYTYVPVLTDDILILDYPDCNNNGILDSIDIANGHLNDCNNNFIADFCEADDYPDSDCNNNSLIDACELTNNPSLDCNDNGKIDFCDIVDDPNSDCDNNGFLDLCEISDNPSLDCNLNGILDYCEIATNPDLDCNQNGSLDICDITLGFATDCNFNQTPDECDDDCNLNGIPDDCETITDCNCNAKADNIDINSGWSEDVNSNFIPDECEGNAGKYVHIYAIDPNGNPTNQLPINEPGNIIFALTTNEEIDGITLPFSTYSDNNSRLWEYLANDNIEYLHKEDLNYIGISSLFSQNDQWPDSLVLSASKTGIQPISSIGTVPLIRMMVTPTKEGELFIDPIQIPPGINFSYIKTSDGIEYPLEMRFDGLSFSCCRVTRGNIDYDIENVIDIGDIIYFVDYQFGTPNGPEPYCFNEADVNNTGSLDIADLIYLVMYQFQNGPPPLPCQE